MKKFIITLLILMCSFPINSQAVQQFEGGLNVGLSYPLTAYHGGIRLWGPELDIEVRKNIADSKFDYGLSLGVATSVYRLRSPDLWDSRIYDQSNRSVNFQIVGDYNFRPSKKINPFCGLGIGVSMTDALNDVLYSHSGTCLMLQSKIGMELFYHWRIGANVILNRLGYCSVGLTTGFVIGGRPVKDRY